MNFPADVPETQMESIETIRIAQNQLRSRKERNDRERAIVVSMSITV